MRTTLHYRPGLSVWTFLFVALVTAPLALLVRWEGRVAQSVTCTTARGLETARGLDRDTHLCWAFDAGTGETRSMSCTRALDVLDDLLGSDSVMDLPTRPFVNAQSTVGPLDPHPVPLGYVFYGDRREDTRTKDLLGLAVPPIPPRSASDETTAHAWPKVERTADGSVTPTSAHALLAACAAAPPAEREVRTVSIAVFARDARGSVAALLLGLLSLAWLLARHARLEIAPAAGEARLREKLGPFTRRAAVVPTAAIADVVVATAAAGPFVGRRVELVLHDGTRLPLLSRFAPFASGSHESAARRIRRALGLASRPS